jgi:uncharacterized membrane protein YoaK (UPF0700 family)
MSGKWVLDTNIIIGFINGAEASARLIAKRGDVELCASVITVALGAPLFTFDRRLAALEWPGLRIVIPA